MREYKLILEHSQDDLNKKITDMLNKGWDVSGNLVVDKDDEGFPYFYQAMIKQG
ncbi:DUF1737 domain-containing protein [Kiloniella laminariae]|uniref:DUF1737 domain-containing protein n=1 Tax=Kiloniella laminariae TaxID=454162 RepID=UPI0003A2907F|nr:DUF1737 domain-containing protein [Kiloniella laminariae]